MKNLLLGALFMLMGTFAFANCTNTSNLNHFISSELNKESLVEIYSTDVETIFYHKAELELYSKKVSFVIGFDANNQVSSLNLSDVLSEIELAQVSNLLLASNCLTDCTRANGCSDKSSETGGLICVGECIVDCAQKAWEDFKHA